MKSNRRKENTGTLRQKSKQPKTDFTRDTKGPNIDETGTDMETQEKNIKYV